MDAMAMIALRALDDPFSGHDISFRFSLAASPEFQMMAFEQRFVPVQRLTIELTYDLVSADLVDPVNPSFHERKDEQHQQDERGRA